MAIDTSNTLTVYVWPPSNKGLNSGCNSDKSPFGHAALQTHFRPSHIFGIAKKYPNIFQQEGFYISFWPGPCSIHKSKINERGEEESIDCVEQESHFHTQDMDGDRPDAIPLLVGRKKIEHINSAIIQMCKDPMGYDLFGLPYKKNCAGVVLDLLEKAKIFSPERLRYLSFWEGVVKILSITLVPLTAYTLSKVEISYEKDSALAKKSYKEDADTAGKSLDLALESLELLPASSPSEKATLGVITTSLINARAIISKRESSTEQVLKNAKEFRTWGKAFIVLSAIGTFSGVFAFSDRYLKSTVAPLDVKRIAILVQNKLFIEKKRSISQRVSVNQIQLQG